MSNLTSKNQVTTEPISEQTKAFLRWVREICVDDSRTYYKRIQGILNVIYHFEKADEDRRSDETPPAPRGVPIPECAVCGEPGCPDHGM